MNVNRVSFFQKLTLLPRYFKFFSPNIALGKYFLTKKRKELYDKNYKNCNRQINCERNVLQETKQNATSKKTVTCLSTTKINFGQ